MRYKRMELLLIVLTVLALGAGVAAGLLAARLPAANTNPITPQSADITPLVAELQLTPAQRDQMRTIWERVRGDIHDSFDRAQRLQKQRDEAIFTILTEEQKSRFQVIAREYADRFTELTQNRDKTFQTAVDQTKTLLNQDQQVKYDQLLKERGAVPVTRPGNEPISR